MGHEMNRRIRRRGALRQRLGDMRRGEFLDRFHTRGIALVHGTVARKLQRDLQRDHGQWRAAKPVQQNHTSIRFVGLWFNGPGARRGQQQNRRQQSGHDFRFGFHGFMRLKLGAIRERNSTPHFSPFRVITQAAGTVR